MVVGGVKAAVAAAAGQGPANEDQRRPGDASLLCLVADIAERAAYQLLVRPADAIGDDRRAIRAVMRQTRADDPREVGDREMDHQRRAARREAVEALAIGHRRGARRGARQYDGL